MKYSTICVSHKSSGLDLIFHIRSVKFEECVISIGFSGLRKPRKLNHIKVPVCISCILAL